MNWLHQFVRHKVFLAVDIGDVATAVLLADHECAAVFSNLSASSFLFSNVCFALKDSFVLDMVSGRGGAEGKKEKENCFPCCFSGKTVSQTSLVLSRADKQRAAREAREDFSRTGSREFSRGAASLSICVPGRV